MRRVRGGVTTSYAKHIHVIQSSIHQSIENILTQNGNVDVIVVVCWQYVPAAAVVARGINSFASFEISFFLCVGNNCFVV